MSRIDELRKSLNVASVSFAPLKAGALVYEDGKSFHIVLNSQLSDAKRLFALLHEMGHLALGILHKNPVENHSMDEELEVNLWAINAFTEMYPTLNKDQLQFAFQDGEQAGYEEVEKQANSLKFKIEDFV